MFSVFGELVRGQIRFVRTLLWCVVKTLIGQTQKYQTDAADDKRRETDENEHCAKQECKGKEAPQKCKCRTRSSGLYPRREESSASPATRAGHRGSSCVKARRGMKLHALWSTEALEVNGLLHSHGVWRLCRFGEICRPEVVWNGWKN